MLRRLLTASAALLLAGAAMVTVFGYNLWSWCCGRCSLENLLAVGPAGMLLVGLSGLALLLLIVLRRRTVAGGCRCGACLAPDWSFCPRCGRPRPTA